MQLNLSFRRASGFSLIEMLVALAIMGLVLMLAIPGYSAWIQNVRLRNTAESILNGLQLARVEAVKRNTPVQFVLVGSSWTVGCVACPTVVPQIDSRATGDGSSSAIMVAPAALTVTFDNLGQRSVPAAATGVTTFDVTIDPAVLAPALSKPLRVRVDVGGNIKMCNPIAVAPDSRACG